MRWIRLHCDCLDNPKVGVLSFERRGQWTSLLCVAGRNEGVLPSIETIAFHLRVPTEDVREIVAFMVERELLDMEGDVIRPHDWDVHQYVSDSSAERTKAYRERKKGVTQAVTPAVTVTPTDRHTHRHCDVTPAVTVTPSETDTDTETEQSQTAAAKSLPTPEQGPAPESEQPPPLQDGFQVVVEPPQAEKSYIFQPSSLLRPSQPDHLNESDLNMIAESMCKLAFGLTGRSWPQPDRDIVHRVVADANGASPEMIIEYFDELFANRVRREMTSYSLLATMVRGRFSREVGRGNKKTLAVNSPQGLGPPKKTRAKQEVPVPSDGDLLSKWVAMRDDSTESEQARRFAGEHVERLRAGANGSTTRSEVSQVVEKLGQQAGLCSRLQPAEVKN